MEKRTVNQIKIYYLVMNMMRDSKIQMMRPVIGSLDKDKLIQWYKDQEVEGWKEEVNKYGETKTYHKSFAKGSKLEWFNPISSFEEEGLFGDGIHEQWVNEGEQLGIGFISEEDNDLFIGI